MRVLGLLGGPRRGGNAEVLLDAALEGARSQETEVEKLVVAEFDIAPCDGLRHCVESEGICHLRDDMDLVYPKLRALDALIVATPTYFMGVPAQLKALIDRCQALWVIKHQLRRPVARPGPPRPGILIINAHYKRRSIYRPALSEVKALFNTVEVRFSGDYFFGGVDEPGEIMERPGALDEAFAAGAALVQRATAGALASP